MKRRFSTRGLGLSVRMLVTIALVLLLYAAIAVGVVALLATSPHIALYTLVVVAAVVVAPAAHVGGAATLILRAVGARPGEGADRLRGMTSRLALQANVPVPTLYVMESADGVGHAIPNEDLRG